MSSLSMIFGDIGKISYFYISGILFYFYFFIILLLQNYRFQFQKSECYFYLYPTLMLTSVVWSQNPKNTLYYFLIIGAFHTVIYFIVCSMNIFNRIYFILILSRLLSIIGLFTATILYLKHGALRGPDINAFGLNLMYLNAFILPFLLCQYDQKIYPICYKQLIISLCILSLIITNILSFSRLAIFTLIITPILFYTFKYGININRFARYLRVFFIVFFILIVTYMIVPKNYLTIYTQRIINLYHLTINISHLKSVNYLLWTDSKTIVPESGRILMLYNAIEIISNHPILGVGYGNSADAGYKISGYRIIIHNLLLIIYSEIGILGLILIVFLILYALYFGFKKLNVGKNLSKDLYSFYSASLTAFIMTIFISFFQPNFNRPVFFLAFALMLSNDFKGRKSFSLFPEIKMPCPKFSILFNHR